MACAAFPLGFGVYTLVRGQLTHFYPAPLLDIAKLGALSMPGNMAVMAIVLAALGFLLVGADRLLARRAARLATSCYRTGASCQRRDFWSNHLRTGFSMRL